MAFVQGDAPSIPSPAAAARLRRDLGTEIDSYRGAVTSDLGAAEEAQRDGDDDRVIALLEAHIATLEALSARVNRIVAGAVVEREAEAVVERSHPMAVAGVRPPGLGVRRLSTVAAALAAVVVLAGAALRPAPPDPLLVAVRASDRALEAAEAAGSGSELGLAVLGTRTTSLRQAIRRLPPDVLAEPEVRAWLAMALTEQHHALVSLMDVAPGAMALLADLDRLTTTLSLPPLPQLGGATQLDPAQPDPAEPGPAARDLTGRGPTEREAAAPGPQPRSEGAGPSSAEPGAPPAGAADPAATAEAQEPRPTSEDRDPEPGPPSGEGRRILPLGPSRDDVRPAVGAGGGVSDLGS